MKTKFNFFNILFILLFLTSLTSVAQKNVSTIDSLVGFSIQHAWEHTNSLKTLAEKNDLFETIKRNWIKHKYNMFPVKTTDASGFSSTTLGQKPIGGNNSTMQGPQPANCTNIDFENGTTSTWATMGAAQVVTGAGLDPNCGFPQVYPGGTSSVKISGDWTVPGSGACTCNSSTSYANFCTSQVSRNITVTAANTQLQIHYAMVVLNFPHSAADAAYIEVSILNSSGTQLPCPYFKVSYYNNAFQGVAGVTASTTPGTVSGCTGTWNMTYLPWQTANADLTPYIGQTVTLVAKVKWCQYDCDWAYAYLDADCLNSSYNLAPVCPGSIACAPNGFAGYNWSIPGGGTATGQCITPSTNGIYTVSCVPSIVCSPVQTITMSAVSGFTPSVINTNVNCNGGNNGSATVSCIGAGPFTYAWLPAGGTGSIATGLAAGNYSAIVSGGGCTITKTFTITQPTALNLTVSQTSSVVCANGNNGIATANASGGSPGYVYNWLPSGGTSSVASNLSAGNFTVQLTDANGCVRTATTQITQPLTTLSSTILTTTSQCQSINPIGLNALTSTLSVGSVTNYAWSFGNSTSSLVNATSSVGVVYSPSGNYVVTLTVSSSAGCTSISTRTVSVFGRAVPNFLTTDVCFNSANNFANLTTTTLNPNTGTIASYSWNFGATSGTSSATNPINTYTNPVNATANTIYTVDLFVTTINGCTDVVTKTLTVYSLPTATFTADSVCIGNPTTLSNFGNNNGNPYFGFNWSCNSSTTANITNVFSTPGNTSVTYTAITSPNAGVLQCKSVFTKNVWVHAGPLAVITNTNKCLGSPIGLSGVTSTIAIGTITNYAWNYGNATSSLVNITPSTSASYTPSGSYLVTLTVTSAAGCSNIAIKTVTAFGRSVINFGPTNVCFNTSTAFTNSTSTIINPNTSAVSSWSWNFGATAGSSTLMNPTNTYTNPANATTNLTYSATLYATTADGCKDSLTKIVTVYSLPTPNFISDSVCLGSQTTLTDISNSNGNPFTLFKWDFNNDGVVDVTNTSLSTQTVFPNFGNNSVTYTVITTPNTTALTCFDKITKNVWVHPIPVAAITSADQCLDTQPVTISGANSNIAIGTVTNYAWAYGNGNTSLTNIIAPTTHSYGAAGNYVLTLTVTSNAGCKNAITSNVNIWERPYGHFSYSKTCLTKRTFLKGYQAPISGTIASYDWDFNNNPTNIEATGGQVSYTFASAGAQTVNMFLTTDKGCKNTIPGIIYINYIPKPNFYSPKRAGCADLCTTVLDSSATLTSPAKNSSWLWTFGNGQSIAAGSNNLSNICYGNTSNYTTQNYTLKLVLRSDSGCVDSLTKNNYITVYPNPKADFNWEGEDGTILSPQVLFTNTSQGYTAYQWYFNDGGKVDSVNRNPSHYFNTDLVNSYNVFLAVRNQYGCKDTISKLVDIGPNFTFYIPNAFTPNDDGVNDVFTGKGIGVKTYKMWIYDRWGEMICYTEDMVKGWNGTIKGNKIDTKMDVYQYKVLITDVSNKQHEYVGHVSLIK